MMNIRAVTVERVSLVSHSSFDEVVARVEAGVAHPEMRTFFAAMASAPDFAALETIVGQAVAPSGLMEFTRFDLGMVLRKEVPAAGRILRLLIGNPVIMKQMARHVPDAGSYAPVTILIDERPDGTHLSYDRVASLLAPYASAEALKVAQALDEKIEGSLRVAAA